MPSTLLACLGCSGRHGAVLPERLHLLAWPPLLEGFLDAASLLTIGGFLLTAELLDGQNRQSPIASVQRTRSTLAGHSAGTRGTNTTPAQRTQGLRGPNSVFLEGDMTANERAAITLASDSAITIAQFRPSKVEFFVYSYVWGLFCLQLELCYLEFELFCLQLSFFAYSGKVCLRSTSTDCKQRSSIVSKKAPTASKTSFPRFKTVP